MVRKRKVTKPANVRFIVKHKNVRPSNIVMRKRSFELTATSSFLGDYTEA